MPTANQQTTQPGLGQQKLASQMTPGGDRGSGAMNHQHRQNRQHDRQAGQQLIGNAFHLPVWVDVIA